MNDQVPQQVKRRLDQAERVYESHGKVFRTMWVLAGAVIVLAGLAMIVFPGPVTIVVPAGLIMLAAVFGWARWLLLRSVEKGVEAKHRVEATSKKAKVLGGVALACVATAVAAAAAAWLL